MNHWYRTYFPEPNWIKIPLSYKANPMGSKLDMKYIKEIKGIAKDAQASGTKENKIGDKNNNLKL